MTTTQATADRMADRIKTGDIIYVSLNDHRDNGFTKQLSGAWETMTAADIEAAETLMNDIDHGKHPNIRYGASCAGPNYTDIFRI